MAQLKLFVLGQPRLERDEAPIELNLRKALALLVYLAVSGQSHSRDALATLLWPESDGREGRARLRRILHRLTLLVGEEILDTSLDTIRLHPRAELWLDCAAFRQHATAGLAAAAQDGVAPERLGHLSAAVELYTADFLAGFTLPDSPAFDEWQFFQRESLRQLYGQLLEQLVQAYRGQQAWDQAIAYARRWVALDGLHEAAHRMLMRLYAWAGQYAAALRQYQECVRILDAELGAPPEDETTALYEAIRTRQLPAPEASDRKADRSSELIDREPHQRYVLEDRLAEGGHGEVYRARDQLTGQPVAIKWLKSELADRHVDYIARFVREGAALRRLNHPNIVGILETFEQAGRYAIVMEYVPGGSLRALLEQAGQLPIPQVLTLGLELADALSRAHHLGIIHRDLKPENVLIAADGTPRLTDFGLARLEWDDARLTQTGTIFGSPAYMSPEAVRGENLDARSDIWSLGVVLYELLVGRPPFEGAQVTPVLASILEDATPDLRQFRADVPPPLVDLLGQMLVKERAERIASMRQVAAALEAIRDGRAADRLLPEQSGAAHARRVGTPAALTSPLSSRSERRTPHSLPLQPTPFIGRDQELADLRRLLLDEPACHLLTVLGSGGIGKTRLAIAVAEAVRDAFPDGVAFVPLAPLASSEPIVSAVAEGVEFRLSETRDAQRQLIDYLRGRHMLLVLDNFEHVLASAGLVVAILQAAPDMKLLVTSRERLNLGGEMVYPLGGMAVPERGVDRRALEYGAVQLLMQQARLVRPNLDVRADDLDAITRICWLVQGTPLALVLAAGWLEVLSFAEIADEIARSLDILESQQRDLPERQRSVRAAFDYSWNQLSAEEQLAFVKLSVFQGGFTRQGAQAVAGADTRMLRTLAHKSLLVLGEDNRYEFHELLRQYATERLKAAPAAWMQTSDQHGAYYVGFLREQGKLMQGWGQKAAFQAVAAEFDNIYAAWNWLVEQQRFETVIHDMLPALFRYCEVRARLPDLMSLLETTRQALAAAPNSADEALTAPLLTTKAAFLSSGYSARLDYYGYLTNANRDMIEQAWAAATPDTVRAMGFMGTILAYLYSRIVDRQQGISPLRQLLGYFQQENQRWERAFTLQHLALLQIWKQQGEAQNETEQLLAEALAIFRELGDERESGCTLRWLGQFHRNKREPLIAIRQWRAAQSILQEAGEWELAADINSQLGDLYLQLGELDQAFRCYRAMSQTYLERGHKRLAIARLSKESYESLRYRGIDQARQTRLYCLALCREVGDVFQEAWSCWEMGEVERVAGDFTAARQWYDQAKKLFDRHDDGGSASFYYRGLADLAYAEGDYTEAQQLYEVSLKHARAADHDWAQTHALSGLGQAALGLGQYETARRQLAEALHRAVALGQNGMALVALARIAGLCAATGEAQRAIELSALVASHYGSWHETRVQAAAVAARAAAALSPDDCAAAQARGQRLELWETASHLLETLAQPNSE